MREEKFEKEIEEIKARIKAQLKAKFNKQLKIIVQLYEVPTTSSPPSSQGRSTTSSLPSSQGMQPHHSLLLIKMILGTA